MYPVTRRPLTRTASLNPSTATAYASSLRAPSSLRRCWRATLPSQGGLADESLLPDRTVRYALNRLEEEGLVDSRYSFKDARKQVYYLTV